MPTINSQPSEIFLRSTFVLCTSSACTVLSTTSLESFSLTLGRVQWLGTGQPGQEAPARSIWVSQHAPGHLRLQTTSNRRLLTPATLSLSWGCESSYNQSYLWTVKGFDACDAEQNVWGWLFLQLCPIWHLQWHHNRDSPGGGVWSRPRQSGWAGPEGRAQVEVATPPELPEPEAGAQTTTTFTRRQNYKEAV